ncbi:Aromatic-ring-hydroxylating dioxygenase alpha subunit [Penicillium bovifimosum]|uniref:Choline monooxygenase, chloroplastic n=1 Tax=Penicillium bovifimosum TaxID=126998 RepID=A0A9W9L5E4_9EURO|nr:Aromatic-ring-hydroxylating dioxygenase alpha subunit [Penicillium bovifimosum]KAJ5139363.1 Aromatic-ring-hydroxylating dioxygenase alpha subunit [Penicillium bovifimosum]
MWSMKLHNRPSLPFEFQGEALNPVAEELQVVCVKTGKKLRSHLTPTGLLFSTVSDDAPSFQDFFPELEELLGKVDFRKLPHRRSIKYEGQFNWKTMVDGYQECLHCQYTHPSFSVYYPPTFYTVRNKHNFSQHIADPKKPDDGLFLYFFPNCTLNVYGGGMSSFRVCPTADPQVTRMEFDYYHLESGDKFEEYFKFVRQVAMEDFELCEKAQSNLTRGVYHEGILNPEKENGVSYYQQRVFDMVCEQHESDKKAKVANRSGLRGHTASSIAQMEAKIQTERPTYRSAEQLQTGNFNLIGSFFPASLLVALATIIFLLRVWPRLSHTKIPKTSPAIKPPNPTPTVSKEPDIPEGWWASRNIFELERRALFSQTWLYVAHSAQFTKAGAYQSFDLAGFPIFLIRGKDGKIRAFHNVCRHRAYTITRKESGASTVLGCRYHGWSYDTTGRLVKAPQFDGVPGFEKERNGLFEVHTQTEKGLVFVNLVSGEPAAFDDMGVTGMGGARWVAGQTLMGVFNWKVGALARAHHFDVFANLNHGVSGVFRSFVKKLAVPLRRSTRKECFLYPTTFFYSLEDGLSLAMSFFPASQSKTHVRYDLFSCSNVSESEAQRLSEVLQSAVKKLVGELETDYQSILDKQELPSEFDSTVSRQILSRLQEHTKLERAEGGQILPAMHKPKGSTLFQQADQLCKELDCLGGDASGALDW